MRVPAWWRQFRARLGGWFWLPCALCGEFFAGYEWKIDGPHEHTIPKGDGWGGSGICPACSRSGLGTAAWEEKLPVLPVECRYADLLGLNFPDAFQEVSIADTDKGRHPSASLDQTRYVTAVAGPTLDRKQALAAAERLDRSEKGS